jgi:hypothetical protein
LHNIKKKKKKKKKKAPDPWVANAGNWGAA